jgi:anti-sigma regulatory factor (Ser/Thr protein kinase)
VDSLIDELSHDRRDERPLVFMRFRPAWAYIEGIREFGRSFCDTTFPQRDVAERARMVLQETLENAIKYSLSEFGYELELTFASDGRRLEISITSAPDPAHLATLKREIDEIYRLDPEAAYLAAVRRAADEPEAAARIGLARIRFEGNAELRVREQKDGRICVTAAASL